MAAQPLPTKRGRSPRPHGAAPIAVPVRRGAAGPAARLPGLSIRSGAEPRLPRGTPRATARGLRSCGLSAEEAANVAAYLEGLPIVGRGWTLGEVERLLFARSLVASRRLGS